MYQVIAVVARTLGERPRPAIPGHERERQREDWPRRVGG